MVRVASGPATGQYSVAAGVYTFAAADTTKTVFIDFAYTATGATAKTSTSRTSPWAPRRLSAATSSIRTAAASCRCRCSSASRRSSRFATKLDDFLIPEFDFSGFADASGNVLQYGVNE
jgi:hypothetical protein